jgi:hypothetical protein
VRLLSARDRVDLRIGRKPAKGLFGECQFSVHGDLEHAARRADEFDFGAGSFA